MRRWLKRGALLLLSLAALWLIALNLALNTPPLASALNRRPERFQIAWRAAWSFIPGRVHVRGLRLAGRAGRTGWSLRAERCVGRIELRALLRRTLRVSELRGDGVRAEVTASRRQPQPRPAARGPRSGRPPWRFLFDRIDLRQVREVRLAGLRIAGDGTAAGALRIVPGRLVRLERARLEMAGAEVRQGPHLLVSGLALLAEADLGPYAPRQHPGIEGWDFLSGRLAARGRVDELPLLDKLTAAAPRTPGALAAELRFERGRLLPGSTLRLTAPTPSPASTFALAGVVEAVPAGAPQLRLRLDARGVAAGRSAERPPVLQVASLSLATTTGETSVRGLVAAARARSRGAATGALPLLAEARAEGVRVDAPSPRLVLRAVLDRLAGRLDVGALLARVVAIEGLEVAGATARFDLVPAAPGPARAPRAPWAVRLDGARLTGLREVALGDLTLVGTASAAATLSLDHDGTLRVPRATFAMPAGRLDVGGTPAARGLGVRAEATVDPVRSGPARARALLRATSGRASLAGEVASLGFLRPYLERTPWLDLQGQGAFTAELALDHGRFASGSRLQVSSSPVAATLFSSRATGRGTVEVAVEPGPAQPRTALRVRFERFGLADRRRPGQAPYLRGSGLRIVAIAPAAVDLTDPVQDFEATLDVPDAELPDLAVYDALLPADAGLSVLGGKGRGSLHLQASTATRQATGTATVSSRDARLRFQNLELRGRLALRAPLATSDLTGNRFDLAGTRLDLDRVATRDVESGDAARPADWWAHAELTRATVVGGDPLSLRGEVRVRMKDSGPLLTLFAQKSALLRWFDEALTVEDVTARASLRLDHGLIAIDPLRATDAAGKIELRSRMRFSPLHRVGDLYVRYGRLAAGVALRDGKRDFRLRKALEWFEGGALPPP